VDRESDVGGNCGAAVLIGERYRLLHVVGRGGMGRVWLARDEVLHRHVAVKEMTSPEWLSDDEQDALAARTMREARTAARLNHPNVVGVHDVVHAGTTPWIVMEYVPSRSLQDVLRPGPLDSRRVAEIGLALLAALRAAHQAGVLHRDIKPGNVLIADDGRVMLTDFGLAMFDDGGGGLTRPGMIMGSPEYVAPERAANGVSSIETDLWALGATLHAATEGRSPYARPTAMATLTALATSPPDPAPNAGALGPVLAGLLQRDPRHRLGVDEVERLLRAAAEEAVPEQRPAEPERERTAASGAASSPAEMDLAAPDRVGALAPGTPPAGTRVGAPDPAATRPRRGWWIPVGGHPRWRWWFPVVATGLAVLAGFGTALAVTPDRVTTPIVPVTGQAVPPGRDQGPDGPGPAYQDGRGPGPQDGPPPPPDGEGVPPPPFECVRPGRTGQAVVASSQPPGEGFAPPDGWTWHRDDSGFRIAVPIGWRYFRENGVSCFQDPRSDRTLSVDPSTPVTGDPVNQLRAEEKRKIDAGVLPGYQQIRIAPTDDGRGAEWECRWTAPYGERIHSLRLLTGGSGTRAYTLGWTAAERNWADGAGRLATARASFRPTA
jgi:tRNA A-37 threonylcarbamoyl transferase component Bud32